jgi:chemotaxis protein MotA
MDFATLGGLILAFVAMFGALFLMAGHGGGHGTSVNLAGFIDPPAIMMVIGGACAVALVGFPLSRVVSLAKTIKLLFIRKREDPVLLIEQLVRLAEVARRDGLLALETKAQEIEHPFVALGIQMAVDGIKPEVVEEVLRTEIRAMQGRHMETKKVFDLIGRCGPAFGLVATLLGLILMLGNLSNADTIGPSMAMALIGTLYGVTTANLIAIPMGEKLGCLNHEEVTIKEIILKGVLAIQSGDSPRVVEQKLSTFLPPAYRARSESEAA